MAGQAVPPSSAPGQPDPCPTAVARSFTVCSRWRTQQGPLCLSPASFSTTQVSKMAGCYADESPLVSSFAFARSLTHYPLPPSLFYSTSTHSTPINLIHPFIFIIYLSCSGQLILGTDNSPAVRLSAKSFIPAQAQPSRRLYGS